MTNWITFAIISYLFYAVNGVADKFLLTKAVKHPIAYAFYIGVTSPLTLLLAPFGLRLLSPANTIIAIFAGICFPLGLYFYYSAIQKSTVSRILPIEGGLVPIFTLLLAYLILGERLSNVQYAAFIFLVIGAVAISFRKEKEQWHPVALGNAFTAAILFALSLTLTKYIFGQSNFISGLIWTRLGFFAASMSFLISKNNRTYIFNAPKETSKGNIFLYYGTRLTGGAAGLLQNYAISIGSVTIVNALQGTQFLFLLLMTSFLSLKFPAILKEHISALTLTQKIFSIALISFGLILLTL